MIMMTSTMMTMVIKMMMIMKMISTAKKMIPKI